MKSTSTDLISKNVAGDDQEVLVLSEANADFKNTKDETIKVETLLNIRSNIVFGLFSLLLGFTLFFAWSVFAPLSSATIAPGVLVVESRRQQIEHLEGGILDQIHIKEGQKVKAGELLLTLRSAASTSRLAQARHRMIHLLAARDRLNAEISSQNRVEFNSQLSGGTEDSTVREAIDLQEKLFQKRGKTLEGRAAVTKAQIEQHNSQLDSIESRLKADIVRQSILEERLAGLNDLRGQGFASNVQTTDVKAQLAAISGSIGDHKAQITRTSQQIKELNQQLLVQENEFVQNAMQELQTVEAQLGEFDSTRSAADDVVRRLEIRAPVSGTIVGLSVTSAEAVIEGGERLMEIVPDGQRLIIDTLLRPEDIDTVYVGQNVQARLTAFNIRNTPPVDGKITHVSADRVVDERTGVAAYSVLVELSSPDLQEETGLKLYPGMPAEVSIINNERTFMSYLLDPVFVVFQKGLRE